jgi:hypothetical protein
MMKLKNKLPDLQNAFGILELYATEPEKQRHLEERLQKIGVEVLHSNPIPSTPNNQNYNVS